MNNPVSFPVNSSCCDWRPQQKHYDFVWDKKGNLPPLWGKTTGKRRTTLAMARRFGRNPRPYISVVRFVKKSNPWFGWVSSRFLRSLFVLPIRVCPFLFFLWLLYWCVGWVLSCDYGKSKSVGLGQTKKEKKALNLWRPNAKKSKSKSKPKKTSLAELPAELKHITQRCKKKVTTIAEVTASEPAIFGETKKNIWWMSLSLSPAWKQKPSVWFKKKRKKKLFWTLLVKEKKRKEKKDETKKKECPALFGSFFGWVVSLFLSSCLSLKALWLDNLEWFCQRGWQPLFVFVLWCLSVSSSLSGGEKNNATAKKNTTKEQQQQQLLFCSSIPVCLSPGVKLFENAVRNAFPTQGVSFESVTNIGCETDSAKVDCSNGEKYFAERVKSIWNWRGFTGCGWPLFSAKRKNPSQNPPSSKKSLILVEKVVEPACELLQSLCKGKDKKRE